MSLSRRPIQVFFEFNSFYSYPAIFAAKEAAAREGLQLQWRPFLLWPVLKARCVMSLVY